MAIAERRLAAEFNRPGHTIVDHRTYVIASDGDLQEGSRLGGGEPGRPPPPRQADRPLRRQPHPARRPDRRWPGRRTSRSASTPTAGTPSGSTTATTSRRSRRRSAAARDDDRPSLIAVRTHIGFGSPNKQDSQKAHGAPLGADEVRLTKEAYGWDPDRTFYVPDEAAARFRAAIPAGRGARRRLGGRATTVTARRTRTSAAELPPAPIAGRLPDGWDADLKTYETGTEVATRNASQDAIAALAPRLPELFGGAADLSESNLTDVKGEPRLQRRRGRPQPPLRRPRARDGRRRQRHRPTTAGSSPTAPRS